MPVIRKENPFKGVNPLFNSLNQSRKATRQSSFQAIYSVVLRDLLMEKLPPQYTADVEQGMELLRFIQFMSRQQSEIEIEVEDRYVAIYQFDPDDVEEKGYPVAVIEMLSPGNLTKDGMGQTKGKLLSYTQAGLVSVWIDLMHAYPSPFPGVPDYPAGVYPDGDSATPYSIAISNPRNPQKRDSGGGVLADIYPFGIDQSIPTLEIPLLGQDAVIVDFDAVYQQAYQRGFYRYVDYEQPPRRLGTYRDEDQALIEQRRQQIIVDLGTAAE